VQPAREANQPPSLLLTWQETGGPPVTPPLRRGFGTRLLEGGLARELSGSVHLSFRPDGVVCELRALLRPQAPVVGA
jgi:two-component sensor histidine kinase